MKFSNSRNNTNSRGFTLLEVLVAIVIFAIGLLGIATLQIAGLRFTHGSQLRLAATMQAENLIDRMHGNQGGTSDGEYNITGAMPTTYDTNCGNEVCTAEEFAAYDLVTWNTENADLLPNGAGVVCIDSTPNDGDSTDWACDDTGDIYAIKIGWSERGIGDSEDAELTQRLVMRFVP
ncbi:MAG: type IV pilus modification protein PilV [Gammaproteobacteria bacterium]